MSYTLRVNTATRSNSIRQQKGSKTGLVDRHPFVFCCVVVPVYDFSSSCRCVVFVL